MSDVETEYEVEKIIKRRYKNGKLQFLLKWVGFPSSENSWEPEDLIFCPDLLNDFIISKGHAILSAKPTNGTIQYLLMWKDGFSNVAITSEEAKRRWPILLLEFLEKNIRLYKPQQQLLELLTFPTVESEMAAGDPINICYVCDVRGELNYWVNYPNNKFKFVAANEVREKFPLLAIEYLEQKLQFE